MATDKPITPTVQGTSRRSLLGAMAVAPVALATAAQAFGAPAADRAAWNALMAERDRLNAESDACLKTVNRIDEVYERLAAKVPHVEIEGSEAYYGKRLTTADFQEVQWRRASAKQVRYIETCAYEGHKWETQLIDAADARDAKLKRISDRLGREAAHDHFEAMVSRMCDVEAKLLDMPAPDGEALWWKVRQLYKPGDGIWDAAYEQQTYDDLARFLKQARA